MNCISERNTKRPGKNKGSPNTSLIPLKTVSGTETGYVTHAWWKNIITLQLGMLQNPNVLVTINKVQLKTEAQTSFIFQHTCHLCIQLRQHFSNPSLVVCLPHQKISVLGEGLDWFIDIRVPRNKSFISGNARSQMGPSHVSKADGVAPWFLSEWKSPSRATFIAKKQSQETTTHVLHTASGSRGELMLSLIRAKA